MRCDWRLPTSTIGLLPFRSRCAPAEGLGRLVTGCVTVPLPHFVHCTDSAQSRTSRHPPSTSPINSGQGRAWTLWHVDCGPFFRRLWLRLHHEIMRLPDQIACADPTTANDGETSIQEERKQEGRFPDRLARDGRGHQAVRQWIP